MGASTSPQGLNMHQFRNCVNVCIRVSVSLDRSVEQGLGASESGNARDSARASLRTSRPAVWAIAPRSQNAAAQIVMSMKRRGEGPTYPALVAASP
eukprot:3973062-Pyramimonas_sp.AAC.1